MALKNNLDIELEQIDQAIADLSVPLAKGGGLPRPINYTVADTPAGEAPDRRAPAQFFLSGSIPVKRGPDYLNSVLVLQHQPRAGGITFLIPGSEPLFRVDRRCPVSTRSCWAGTGGCGGTRQSRSYAQRRPRRRQRIRAITDNTLGDTLLTKGFSPGTTIQLGVNNFVQSFYSGRSSAVPFSHPNAYALIAQPLLRGAGRANNTRYIAIAKTNKRSPRRCWSSR